MELDKLIIRGARENNLKNISLEIPRNKMVVMTGLSGSGKTSLAFDTIYAEGQRRYVESLSAYARMFLGGVDKPDVEQIEGLSPAISIDQKTTSNNPRSTVGTVTEIYDYLRLLYARCGVPYCPNHNIPITGQDISEMVSQVMSLEDGTRLTVMAPIIRNKKGTFKDQFSKLMKDGYVRVRVDGEVKMLEDDIELEKNKRHNIDVVVDRIIKKPEGPDKVYMTKKEFGRALVMWGAYLLYLALLYWDSEMFRRSSRKRRELEEEQEEKDYKALCKDLLFLNTEKYTIAKDTKAKLDCWRASRTALQPAQFLCATNGTAATDVLALWPMNVQDGAYVDGTDVAGGNYTFEDPCDAMYRAAAGDGAPEIPGLSTAADGCAEFRSANGSGRNRSYLICYDQDTVGTLSRTNGCTFEVYLYPTYQPSGNEYEFIYLMNTGTLNALGSTTLGGTSCANLTYRANGFVIFVNGCLKDEQFKDADGQPVLLPLNTWSHVALTLHAEGSTCIFDLYIDGVKRGTLTSSSGTPRTATDLFLGGRYASANSFRGKMSLLRISRGVLSTNEFLCARATMPESRAYWPLDGVPALDLTGRIDGGDGKNDFTAWLDVTGLAAGASSRVPRPDTSTNFTGNASANAGAVQLAAGGYAQAKEAGMYVDLDDSFTAEGWINWARSQGAVAEVVCGTYASGKGGWKLVLDSTGATPTLRLRVDGEFPVSALANGVLMADASSLEGSWHHLALRYDAAADDGAWSLLVDGVAAGSVTNAWRPSSIFDRAEFRLGAFDGDTSFVGGYDMWRISRGIRTVDDILWVIPSGTTVIFR